MEAVDCEMKHIISHCAFHSSAPRHPHTDNRTFLEMHKVGIIALFKFIPEFDNQQEIVTSDINFNSVYP